MTVDEGRHAALAWRFVQWVLRTVLPDQRREVATTLLEAVESELFRCGFDDDALGTDDAELRAHGTLSASTHQNLRRTVLSEIILPCARALVASTPMEVEIADFEFDIPTS